MGVDPLLAQAQHDRVGLRLAGEGTVEASLAATGLRLVDNARVSFAHRCPSQRQHRRPLLGRPRANKTNGAENTSRENSPLGLSGGQVAKLGEARLAAACLICSQSSNGGLWIAVQRRGLPEAATFPNRRRRRIAAAMPQASSAPANRKGNPLTVAARRRHGRDRLIERFGADAALPDVLLCTGRVRAPGGLLPAVRGAVTDLVARHSEAQGSPRNGLRQAQWAPPPQTFSRQRAYGPSLQSPF